MPADIEKTEQNLPGKFREYTRNLLGDEYPDFIAALADDPPVSLRLNPERPGAEFSNTEPIPWEKNGYYLAERPPFYQNPLIYSGGFYVQEASSMLIGQAADFSRPMNILDLCAAPGGKSTLLASHMAPGSLLVSNEIVRKRADALEENITRWGNPNVVITTNRPQDFSPVTEFFDLILVDAPCSGEGMFRKDPKTIRQWSPALVFQCASRQKEILESIVGSLKPGGRLIYSTCTYNKHENEETVQWLLDRDQGAFKLIDLKLPEEWGIKPGFTEGFDPEMSLTNRCFPHKVRGEGFFFACFEKLKSSHSPTRESRPGKKGKDRRHHAEPDHKVFHSPSKNEKELILNFFHNEDFELITRAGNVEALPENLAASMEFLIPRLNVIKAGIRVGAIKPGSLVPDHDLALSGEVEPDIPRIELSEGDAIGFLKRKAIAPETGGIRGWAIVTYKDLPIGWIKVLDSRVNIHLPKHLRIRKDFEVEE